MGTPSTGIQSSMNVRTQARANRSRAQEAGEKVHITSARGDVRVQRAGSPSWERVPSEGMTINADDKVKTADGAEATLVSKTSGTRVIRGGSFGSGDPASPTGAGERRRQRGIHPKRLKIPRAMAGVVTPR